MYRLPRKQCRRMHDNEITIPEKASIYGLSVDFQPEDRAKCPICRSRRVVRHISWFERFKPMLCKFYVTTQLLKTELAVVYARGKQTAEQFDSYTFFLLSLAVFTRVIGRRA